MAERLDSNVDERQVESRQNLVNGKFSPSSMSGGNGTRISPSKATAADGVASLIGPVLGNWEADLRKSMQET